MFLSCDNRCWGCDVQGVVEDWGYGTMDEICGMVRYDVFVIDGVVD